MTTPSPTAATRFLDRVGIPAPLLAGFIGVLLFMIGDGVESNYLSTFLAEQPGFAESSAAVTISLYGIFVAIGSWFAGTLSSILGPRRVMLIGGIAWVVLEVVFLAIGIGAHVTPVAIVAYALRGIGYPFFAYAFLVWLNTATPAHQRGSSVGWFWFVFGAGLPTLGSLVARWTIPHIGEFGTFWLSTGIVAVGLVVALVGVRDLRHAGPTQSHSRGAFSELAKGLTILWRDPRVAAGAFVRLVNTTPNFALFVVAPFFFVKQVGFAQEDYLLIVTIVYTANIFANLFFGLVGDRFGWKRTVTWFGCVMCAVGVLALYYVPLLVGPSFWLTVVCWAVFGIGLAGFVPLTALVPSMVKVEDRGSALAVYTLAAGLSAFLGPALVAVLGGVANMTVLIWVFAALYVVGAIVTRVLRTDQDPGQAQAPALTVAPARAE
jgi:polyol permease family